MKLILLIKKRADLVLYERWGALAYIKKEKLSSVKLQKPRLEKKEMFIYLNKKHRNLVPKLNKALKQMKQDGSYKHIVNKILMPLERIE